MMIETNGVTLHVVLEGPEDGPPVILLHGFPEFWISWEAQIEALAAAGFRVAAPDQRGYNRSDVPEGLRAYGIRTLTADVMGLADALGFERFNLAGHDWGAMVAWSAAITHPQRIDRLAIANVPHPDVMVRTLRSSFEQLRRSWYALFFQIPRLPEMILSRRNFATMTDVLKRSSRPGTFPPEKLERYREAWSTSGLSGMLNWYRAASQQILGRVEEDRRVHVPTLIIWGRKDHALSDRMVEPSAALCDEARVVYFDEATHWVQHEEPQAVSDLLIEHFRAS
ncbi:MAG: alpha/beta hydrolase [Chloroflexi bacterium]|nr:alpha/beta hydrolase [Chloroflexota bacterium]